MSQCIDVARSQIVKPINLDNTGGQLYLTAGSLEEENISLLCVPCLGAIYPQPTFNGFCAVPQAPHGVFLEERNMVFHKSKYMGFLSWGKSDDPPLGETDDENESDEQGETDGAEVDVNGNSVPTASDSYD